MAEKKVEKKELGADDAALERVLKALGLTKEELDAIEARKKTDEEMIDYDITPVIVYINGDPQPCKGRVPRSKWEVISHMAGSLRDRMMQEAFGKKGQAILRHGVVQSMVVEEVEDALGRKVGQ